jgi:hypothetical protein
MREILWWKSSEKLGDGNDAQRTDIHVRTGLLLRKIFYNKSFILQYTLVYRALRCPR